LLNRDEIDCPNYAYRESAASITLGNNYADYIAKSFASELGENEYEIVISENKNGETKITKIGT